MKTLFVVSVLIAAAALNIWYWQRRAKMTADEREAEDAAVSSDLQQW